MVSWLHVQVEVADLLPTRITIRLPEVEAGRIENVAQRPRDERGKRHHVASKGGIDRVDVLDVLSRHDENMTRHRLPEVHERHGGFVLRHDARLQPPFHDRAERACHRAQSRNRSGSSGCEGSTA